jgi:PAS domain S-box-containing protein
MEKASQPKEPIIVAESADETRSRLAAIVEGSDDAIVAKDLNGIITSWNKSAERMFGYSEEEVLGKPIALIIPADMQAEEVEILRRLRSGERIEHFETVRVSKEGKRVLVSLTISPVRDSSGKIVGASKIARDITRIKETELALREAHEQLDAKVKERTSELNQAQERLRMLSARLLQMQDDERRRIARELHDTAGQILVALNLNLVPVEGELQKSDPGLAKQITESLRLVEELSRDLRTMSHLLHPPLLDEAGLLSAVRWYVEGFAERSKIDVDLHLDPKVGRLPEELETAVFRIVQECLTNIHRHSGSNSASIVITRDEHNVTVEIRDQGRGMAMPVRAGVGIQGMGERARQLGGRLEIESGNGGTRVAAIFPADPVSPEPSAEVANVAS